jgi:hypothetical protein
MLFCESAQAMVERGVGNHCLAADCLVDRSITNASTWVPNLGRPLNLHIVPI